MGMGYGYGIAQAPDSGAQVGSALASIGKSLQGIIDPDYDLQKHMQAAIATNPELGQTLADRAYVSGDPKFLDKMGLKGKVADQIRATPPSIQAHVQAGLQHHLGQDGTDDLNEMMDNISKLPPAAQDMARKAMGMPTADEQQMEDAKASSATSNATTAGNNAQVSTAQLPVTMNDINAHINYAKNPVSDQEAQGIMKQIVTGDEPLTDRAIQAIHYDPNGIGKAITDRIAAQRLQRQSSMENAHLALQQMNSEREFATSRMNQLKDYESYSTVAKKNDATLQALNSSDPNVAKAAYSSIPGIVASVEAVRPNLRSQLYSVMKSLSPEWDDKAEQKLEAGIYGTLPPKLLKGFTNFIGNQVTEMYKGYKSEYDDVGNSPLPKAQGFMRKPDIMFGGLHYGGPGASSVPLNQPTTSIPASVISSVKANLSKGATMDQLKSSQLYKQYGDPLLKAVQ